MSDVACPTEWTNVARYLREAREEKNLSIDQIATRTRVGAHHLEAIEEARFESFRSPVYAMGFAKSYAWAVGLADQPVRAAIRQGFAELMPEVLADEGEPHDVNWRVLGSLAVLGIALTIGCLIALAVVLF